MNLLPSKKTSWTLLILLFIFDNFFSYHAITNLNGREANLAIAALVETYPWLYFLCIPATILIMAVIVLVIKKICMVILKERVAEDILERIILGSLVIYWAIGNSSLNLAFLLGHRQSIQVWGVATVVGVISGLVYGLAMLSYEIRNRE